MVCTRLIFNDFGLRSQFQKHKVELVLEHQLDSTSVTDQRAITQIFFKVVPIKVLIERSVCDGHSSGKKRRLTSNALRFNLTRSYEHHVINIRLIIGKLKCAD